MTKYDVFLKTVESGSFTSAANEIGYSQSAVSQMIQTLENELNTTLVIRSKKGISLTEDGISYLPYIKNLSRAYSELESKITKMNNLQGGTVKIGAFASVSANWLPILIKEFKQKYPDVQFKLMQGTYKTVTEWLRYGNVDICFVTPQTAEEFESLPLYTDEMIAVLPQGHKLSSKENITLKDFENEPFIFLDDGNADEPLEFFKKNNINPDLQYRVFDDITIMNMVEQGLGVSILPRLVLKRHYQNLVLKSISPQISRTISVAYRNKDTMTLAAKYFLNFVITRFNSKDI